MKDFIAMGRIKYRKAWFVYIVDISLEVKNSEIWNYFVKGKFSVQKSTEKTNQLIVNIKHAVD